MAGTVLREVIMVTFFSSPTMKHSLCRSLHKLLISGYVDGCLAWDSVSNLGTIHSTLAMPIFPKASNDHSCDFLFVTPAPNYGKPTIYMFHGGPDFGSHRLTLDSAAFIIRQPQYVFGTGNDWPQSIADAGDMTGTGKLMFCIPLHDCPENDFGDRLRWDAYFLRHWQSS